MKQSQWNKLSGVLFDPFSVKNRIENGESHWSRLLPTKPKYWQMVDDVNMYVEEQHDFREAKLVLSIVFVYFLEFF